MDELKIINQLQLDDCPTLAKACEECCLPQRSKGIKFSSQKSLSIENSKEVIDKLFEEAQQKV